MSGKYLIAIDPGNIQSGVVVVEHNGEKILKVVEKGKYYNAAILELIDEWDNKTKRDGTELTDVAIEMIASYGMPVGREVFDTCVWIGEFTERSHFNGISVTRVYRKDEKMEICGTMKAKDANIRQALIDEYAPGVPNDGKGRKADPGFFYGFKADIWQAFAVAHTFLKLNRRREIEFEV